MLSLMASLSVHDDDKSSWGSRTGRRIPRCSFSTIPTKEMHSPVFMDISSGKSVTGDFVSAGSPLGRTGDYVGGIPLAYPGCFWALISLQRIERPIVVGEGWEMNGGIRMILVLIDPRTRIASWIRLNL